MMEEAAGGAPFEANQMRAVVAGVDGPRRALGRRTFAAIQALLAFNCNHLLEVSEQQQRLPRPWRLMSLLRSVDRFQCSSDEVRRADLLMERSDHF